MVSASVCLVFSTAGDTDNCSDVRELSVFSSLTRSSAFSSFVSETADKLSVSVSEKSLSGLFTI